MANELTGTPADGSSPAGAVPTKADKARAYRLKLKETLDQAALEESRRKNRCGFAQPRLPLRLRESVALHK